MSEYNYTCACCGKHWHSTSTGPKPTKAEIARMVCQPCRDASKRIAALEAENAALREEVKEQDEREAKWAKRFDQQIGHYAVRLYNSRKRRILIARRRISALRAEVAALREDKARLDDMERLGITVSHRGGMPASIKRWTAKCDCDSRAEAILHAADDPRAAIDDARKAER